MKVDSVNCVVKSKQLSNLCASGTIPLDCYCTSVTDEKEGLLSAFHLLPQC